VVASLIPCCGMSKDFRPWKIDEAPLLPPPHVTVLFT
jgi:hypothetical protein